MTKRSSIPEARHPKVIVNSTPNYFRILWDSLEYIPNLMTHFRPTYFLKLWKSSKNLEEFHTQELLVIMVAL